MQKHRNAHESHVNASDRCIDSRRLWQVMCTVLSVLRYGTFRGFNLRGGNSVGGESDVQSSQLYHHPPKVIFRSNRWWKLISIRPEPADDDGAVWHHSSAAASGRCAVIGVGTAHLTIYNSDPVICSCVDDVLVLCSSSSVVLSQWTSVGPSCRRWAHLVEHNMHVLFNPTWGM